MLHAETLIESSRPEMFIPEGFKVCSYCQHFSACGTGYDGICVKRHNQKRRAAQESCALDFSGSDELWTELEAEMEDEHA